MKMRIHHFWLLLITIFSFLIVSACSNGVPKNSVSSQPSLSASDCRNVQHALGETCVPINPQRVIVLDSSPLDAALALGIKPVGMTGFNPAEFKVFGRYQKDEVSEIEEVGSSFQPNIEKILVLKPDLILGCQFAPDKPTYEQLSQIASIVVVQDCGEWKWKEGFKTFAEALGKTQEAEALLGDYHVRVAGFQRAMGDRLKTTKVSLVESESRGVRIYLGNNIAVAVIEEIGLPRPISQRKELAAKEGWAKFISLETLYLADGDVIFILERPNESDPDISAIREMQRNPLWSQLTAVKQGKVYTVNFGWATQRSIGGANWILDDLFKYLIEEWKE